MEINKIYHIDNKEGLLLIPEKSASLIISDPPYFEVKGDFDFIWKSFDEYLEFIESQAILYKKVLADNGTIFIYGHAKRIAYVQVIFDKYFNLENNITWEKTECQTRRGMDGYRCFAPITERILMYSNEVGMTGLEEIYSSPDCFKSIKKYMRDERSKLMIAKGFKTLEAFNVFINDWTNTANVVSRHYFSDSQWCFPTKEIYRRLQETGFWQREYEGLRQEYEGLRRPFDNVFKLTDVFKFSQESHITKNYNHETVKPDKLTQAIILTCSKKDDLIVVPFAGSGTECAIAAKTGRRFIGFDTNKDYVEMANKRVDAIINNKQDSLFDLY